MSSISSPLPKYLLSGSDASVSCIRACMNTDRFGDALFSGTSKGTIDIWNLQTRTVKSSFKNIHGSSPVIWLQELTKGSQIICQGRDQVLNLIDVESGVKLEKIYQTNYLGFSRGLLLLDNKSAILPDEDGIVIVDLNNKCVQRRMSMDNKCGMLMNMYCYDNDHLLCGYEDGSICCININMMKEICRGKVYPESILTLAADKVQSKGVAGSVEDSIKIFDIDISVPSLTSNNDIAITNKGISCLCLRNDNKLCASGGWDGRVRVFTWPKMRPLAVLQYHSDTVNSVDFSSQNYLITAGKDKTICIWDIYRK